MRVTWDEAKNRANRRKHGLSFEEAAQLFTGRHEYLEVFDGSHSWEEDRLHAIGPISRGVILVVHNEQGVQDIRLISARMATRRETELYYKFMNEARP